MTSTELAGTPDICGFDTEEGAYPFYARIREEEPVFWSERLQRWILTRYDDVLDGYRDPARFSSKTFGIRGAATTDHVCQHRHEELVEDAPTSCLVAELGD